MPDNNYNLIKPVEGLQSLTGVNPVSQRRHRQRKENLGSQNDSGEPLSEEESEQQENNTDDKSSKYRMDFKA
jgi:hypothetical protein